MLIFEKRKNKILKILVFQAISSELALFLILKIMDVKLIKFLLIALCMAFFSCEEKFEPIEAGIDTSYQPLDIGSYWIYEVDQTIYFGENDSESDQFFYRDRIRNFYLSAQNEPVFVVERAKSYDQVFWVTELEYTLDLRENLLVRTIQNQPVVVLNFPMTDGKAWDGMVFQPRDPDEFETEILDQVDGSKRIKVIQEEFDDLITVRDNRYEIYGEKVGMIEKLDEVISYCSRNDCLGDQLIDGGYSVFMKLVDYGKN